MHALVTWLEDFISQDKLGFAEAKNNLKISMAYWFHFFFFEEKKISMA